MKTAVVTGGNAGIGFASAREMAQRGWRVIITGRDESKLRAAASAIGGAEFRVADFASLADVRALAQALNTEPRIDVLVNNIGVSLSRRQVSRDGNDMMLQVNHLGAFLLTTLLIDKLKESAPARVVNVSSHFHYSAREFGFDDFQFEHSYSVAKAYARTKLYNVLFTRELARRLASTGVTANALHPGVIRSALGHDGDLRGIIGIVWPILQRWTAEPAEAGARVVMHVAADPALEGVTGKYFSKMDEAVPSALAQDDAAAKRLWEMSEKLVGL
jgi:NAD(P)-dependent dehydrogenase (short-subunit alcohol dehydrogenase family)